MPYQVERPEGEGFVVRSSAFAALRSLGVSLLELMRGLFRGRAHVPRPSECAGTCHEPRLMLREEGSVRCTACMLCATVCPSDCIRVEVDTQAGPEEERKPAAFEIDLLKCVFCGACVEACPCDALRMDTGRVPPAGYDTAEFIYDMERLSKNHPEGMSPLSRAL